MAATIRRELLPGRDPSPFDTKQLRAERTVAFASAPLSELKRIGLGVGGGATANDALLALIAGGLRYWMGIGRVPASLRVEVPLSLQAARSRSARQPGLVLLPSCPSCGKPIRRGAFG